MFRGAHVQEPLHGSDVRPSFLFSRVRAFCLCLTGDHSRPAGSGFPLSIGRLEQDLATLLFHAQAGRHTCMLTPLYYTNKYGKQKAHTELVHHLIRNPRPTTAVLLAADTIIVYNLRAGLLGG